MESGGAVHRRCGGGQEVNHRAAGFWAMVVDGASLGYQNVAGVGGSFPAVKTTSCAPVDLLSLKRLEIFAMKFGKVCDRRSGGCYLIDWLLMVGVPYRHPGE